MPESELTPIPPGYPVEGGKPENLVPRLREIIQDPNTTPETRDGVKKLLDELSRSGNRFRWDLRTRGRFATTTPDCPSDDPDGTGEYKDGWGEEQIIAVAHDWCSQLLCWAETHTSSPYNAVLCPEAKLDILIGSLLHEMDHAERGGYTFPFESVEAEADVEVPAHCVQIEFYQELLGQCRLPYRHPKFCYYTACGWGLNYYMGVKIKQKEEWRSKQ